MHRRVALACVCTLLAAAVAGCEETPLLGFVGAGPDNTILVTGTIGYDSVPFDLVVGQGLDYARIAPRPGRGLVVHVVSSAGARDQILAQGVTSDAGTYSLRIQNDVGYFVRVFAALQQAGAPSWDIRVVDNILANRLPNGQKPVWFFQSADRAAGSAAAVDINATSGWNGAAYDANTRFAGPFAILDVVKSGLDLVLAANPGAVFPPLLVNWSPNNVAAVPLDRDNGNISGPHFDAAAGERAIYLPGMQNNNTDEYDAGVVAHEFGHYFDFWFSRYDSIGGDHNIGDQLDARVAWGEGLGNALAGMITGDSVYRDTSGALQAGGFSFDMEDNSLQNADEGWWSEFSVMIILYDLFDANADVPADTLSLGFGPILQALGGAHRNSEAFTSLITFINTLKRDLPAQAAAIDALVASEAIGALPNAVIIDDLDQAGSYTNVVGFGSLYTGIPANGQQVQLCGTDQFGIRNKHLSQRFFYFDVPAPAPRNVTITVSPGSANDVGFFYRIGPNGALTVQDAVQAVAPETITQPFPLGRHVGTAVDITHFLGPQGVGQRCYSVSVTLP